MKTQLEEFCGALAEIKPATAEQVRANVLATVIEPRLKKTGAPEEHWGERRLTKGQIERLSDLKSRLKNCGATCALVGIRGVGKTTLAVKIIRDLFWEDYQSIFDQYEGKRTHVLLRTCRYVKMGDLAGVLKPLYADFGTVETSFLLRQKQRLLDVDLLVIDELAEATIEPRFKDPILTDIVDCRYASLRDTILISNQSREAFIRDTNESIISRLTQRGGVLVCAWKSFREAA